MTYKEFFQRMNEIFDYTVDVAADDRHHMVGRYYTEKEDGLKQDWTGERAWCNPPWGPGMYKWISKGLYVSDRVPYRHNDGDPRVTFILPEGNPFSEINIYDIDGISNFSIFHFEPYVDTYDDDCPILFWTLRESYRHCKSFRILIDETRHEWRN